MTAVVVVVLIAVSLLMLGQIALEQQILISMRSPGSLKDFDGSRIWIHLNQEFNSRL